jgi:hypothetical protein
LEGAGADVKRKATLTARRGRGGAADANGGREGAGGARRVRAHTPSEERVRSVCGGVQRGNSCESRVWHGATEKGR